MDIAFLVYDKMTALDLIGPYQLLALMPGAQCHLVASKAGPKRTDAGLTLIADRALHEVPAPAIVVVPGSSDPSGAMEDAAVLAWLREVSATAKWTTSVCTGALILGAAGLLRGRRATTHWAAMSKLRAHGAEPVSERVVIDGQLITAAGVSAGIDMALRLAAAEFGDVAAQIGQLILEYDPEPPFNAGSPRTAPAPVLAAVKEVLKSAAPIWRDDPPAAAS